MRMILVLLAGVAVAVVSAAPAPAADPPLLQNGRIVFLDGRWNGVDGRGWRRSVGSSLPTGLAKGRPTGRRTGRSFRRAGLEQVIDPHGGSDGTNVRRLTTGRLYPNNPSWSPDGQRLVFDDGAEGTTSGRRRGWRREGLVPNSSPSWSPDSEVHLLRGVRRRELRRLHARAGLRPCRPVDEQAGKRLPARLVAQRRQDHLHKRPERQLLVVHDEPGRERRDTADP